MDDRFFTLFILLIVAYGVRLLTVRYQVANMLNATQRLKKRGYQHIGIGQGKDKGLKELVMICTDDKYLIVHAERMSGITVFDKYRNFDLILGLNASDIAQNKNVPGVSSKRLVQAIVMACQQILQSESSQKE